MKKLIIFCISLAGLLLIHFKLFSQMTLTFTSQINYVCDGDGCNYSGPSILINEVMLTPSTYDGSLYDMDGTRRGEWIELYNPDLCSSIDISCYYLGNNAPDPSNYGGGFRIPAGTIVPSRGFVIIRGGNGPAVDPLLLVQNGGNTYEFVVDNLLGNICIEPGGNRLWFPNAGGWFAFYDANGIPQDAISWNSTTNSCMSCSPCISSGAGCQNSNLLPSYNAIPPANKTYITPQDPALYMGQSWGRIPDGGAWATLPSSPTTGNCNSICNPPAVITCNGEASVSVSGGTPPYTYIWDDPQSSNADTAGGLCAGLYCVTVSDANNSTQVACVTIVDFQPTATFNPVPAVCENNPSFNLTTYVSPSGGTFTGNYLAGSNFDPSAAGAGSHPVAYIYQDTNSCADTAAQNITVNPLPNVGLATLPDLCEGSSPVQLTQGTPSGGTYSGPGISGSTFDPVISGTGSHTIVYNYTDGNNCTGADSANIIVHSLPEVVLLPINENCENSCNGQVLSNISGGTQPYVYLWNGGQPTPDISVLCAGIYSLTITDSFNCSAQNEAIVGTNTILNTNISATPQAGSIPLIVSFSYYGSIMDTYLWDFGDGTGSTLANPSHTYNQVGSYLVTLIVNTGLPDFCTDTLTIVITAELPSFIIVPNVFTPNGDGSNDEFIIVNQSIESFTCTIFNRWGKHIYEWNDINNGWDGRTEGGKTASDGVYYFILYAKGIDELEYNQHGTVTLMK